MRDALAGRRAAVTPDAVAAARYLRPVRARPFLALPLLLAACGSGGGGTAELSPRAKALLAALPPAYRTADVAHGEAVFSLCRACHTIVPGQQRTTGPNLHDAWGARAAARPGFAYSDALRATGWTWDAARLDHWLTDPQAAVPGTKMTFTGLSDPADRRDVIAYLRLTEADATP